MKLISMTDFVLEQLKWPYTKTKKIKIIRNYAQFLKQPLNLGMFVPCDLKSNVLKQPEERFYLGNDFTTQIIISREYEYYIQQYKKAQERVLFEDVYGIEYIENIILDRCSTIEDLLSLKIVSFELTKSAQKQIGL